MKLKYQFIPHTPNVKKYDLTCALKIHGLNIDYQNVLDALTDRNIEYEIHTSELHKLIDKIENGFIIFRKGKSNHHIAPIKDKIYYDKKDYRNVSTIYALIEIKKD